MNDRPDRLCVLCNETARWYPLNAVDGLYMHVREDGEFYISSHAPTPRIQFWGGPDDCPPV